MRNPQTYYNCKPQRNMKISLVLSILFFANMALFSQNSFQITGRVLDKESQNPIEYCNISIISKNSILAGGITDAKGYFKLELQKSNYKMVISYVGYKTDTFDLGFISSNRYLGNFELFVDNVSLNEVLILESKTNYKIDKTVITITDSERKQASELADLVEKIGGVSFDRINNKYSVDNSSTVKFLVNGIEKDNAYIQGINPLKIKLIEILRYPTGKYALENYSAVINIVTFTDYVGYDFLLEDMLIPNFRDVSKIANTNKANALFNYTINKTNLYIGINNNYNQYDLKRYSSLKNDSLEIITQSATQNSLRSNIISNELLAGGDFNLNPKNTISYEIKFLYPNENSNDFENEELFIDRANDSIILTRKLSQVSNIKNKRIYNVLLYRHQFDLNKEIQIQYNFNQGNKITEQSFGVDENLFLNRISTASTESYLSVDYNQAINNKLSTNLGGIQINSFLNSTSLLSDFKSSTNRTGLYSYFSYSFNNNFGLKIGYAFEYMILKNGLESNYYYILQPNLNFRLNLNKNITVRVIYNIETGYPSTNQILPSTLYLSNYFLIRGNSQLRPSYVHNVNTSINFFKNKLEISPYFRYSENLISERIYEQDSTFLVSYVNADFYIQTGVKINMSFPFFKNRLMLKTSFDLFESEISCGNDVNRILDWTANNQLIYNIPKFKTMFIVNHQKYIYKSLTINGYKSSGMDYWMLGTRNVLFKNRLTIMLMYTLPLDFLVSYEQKNYMTKEKTSNLEVNNLAVLKNLLMIKLTFKIGNGKQVKSIEKKLIQVESEDNKLF